jgi:hypothetical protein
MPVFCIKSCKTGANSREGWGLVLELQGRCCQAICEPLI